MVNPLLCVLNEAQALGDNPARALLKLMAIACCTLGEEVVHQACLWHHHHGAPDYAKLRAWAAAYAAEPAHAPNMAWIRAQHEQTLASFTAAERAEVAKYLE